MATSYADLFTAGPRGTPASHGERTRLRVAFLCDEAPAPWVAHVIAELGRSSARYDILLIDNGAASGASRVSAHALLERLDRRIFGTETQIGGTPGSARVPPRVGSTAAVGDFERLDVVVDTATAVAPERTGGISPRFGVWRVLHGGAPVSRSSATVLHALANGRTTAETSLVAYLDARSPGVILDRSCSRLHPLSITRSEAAACWRGAAMLLRKLEELQRCGWERLPGTTTASEVPSNPMTVPGLAGVLRHGVRSVATVAHNRVRNRLARTQWFVAYRHDGGEVRTLAPPPDRFFADPWLHERAGHVYLFFEDFSFAERLGCISCVEVHGDGRHSPPRLVLERPYHLSYPSIFELDGQTYMLPETLGNRTIELYRAVEFPHRWVLERVLLDGIAAVDTTLLRHGGRLWLLTNVASSGVSAADELCLFSAASLDGEWIPHPRNPVISDVRRARPAGGVYVDGGRLIRPSQDGAARYGHAVRLNRIDRLDGEEYAERTVARIEPDWFPGNLATHTYSRAGRLEAVDGQRWVARNRLGRILGYPRADALPPVVPAPRWVAP